jgi:predicted nuclease of predicted toxin-antitoxin system
VRFLVDNAVSPVVARGLTASGHDAIHVRDLGMAASPDPPIFELAAQQDRILISGDTDFGALLAFRESPKPSFILFRQTDKRPTSQLKLLLAHLPQLEDDLSSGCVVVFDDARIRIRALPIFKS